MLAIPASGFRRSVNEHNSDLMVVVDWVEGSVLFDMPVISKMDVADILIDELVYSDQTFASEFTDIIWSELRRREAWLGKYSAFAVLSQTVSRKKTWRQAAGHAFCLMLTFLQRYKEEDYPNLHVGTMVKQGDLFERFAEECMKSLGWKTFRTGWASGINNPAFAQMVNDVADALNEEWTNNEGIAAFQTARDEGLDLVIHRPFPDERNGRPYYLVQCASGENWAGKLQTPKVQIWRQLVLFTTPPNRSFCCPLAFSDSLFKTKCIECEGMLVDRYRLLWNGAGLTSKLPAALSALIRAWLAPRVAALPTT